MPTINVPSSDANTVSSTVTSLAAKGGTTFKRPQSQNLALAEVQPPEVNPTTTSAPTSSSISTAATGAAAAAALSTGSGSQAELQTLLQKRDAQRKQLSQAEQQRLNELQNQQSTQDKLKQEQAKQGVPQKEHQVETTRVEVAQLQGKLDNLDAQEQDALAKEDSRMASADVIAANKKRIQREYDRQKADVSAQLGAKSAMLQAYVGNLNSANGLVKESVNAFTYDQKQKLDVLDTVVNDNKDWLNSLDSDVKDFIVSARDQANRDYQTQRDEMTRKMNLVIDAANKGVDLGLTPNQIKTSSTEDVLKLYKDNVGAAVRGDSADTAQLTSVDYLKQQRANGVSKGELEAKLDANTKLTAASREAILRSAGFPPSTDGVTGVKLNAIQSISQLDPSKVTRSEAESAIRDEGIEPTTDGDVKAALDAVYGSQGLFPATGRAISNFFPATGRAISNFFSGLF